MTATVPPGVLPSARPVGLVRLCDDHHDGDCAVLVWSDGTVAHSRLAD